MPAIDDWYLHNLVCPVEHTPLAFDGRDLISAGGRRYPVVDGMPVMLVADGGQTIPLAAASLARARGEPGSADPRAPQLYLESLGISEAEKERLIALADGGGTAIDPVVMLLVGATSGLSYGHLIGSTEFDRYPIPDIPLPPAAGATLLDLGCSWGRWSVAAARKGHRVIGIDPSLGAVMAARRVAASLGLDIRYVVGDCRFLPFRAGSIEVAYSYSVLQHFARSDAMTALREAARCLKSGGTAKIQMANARGLRSLQHQLRRGFREETAFEVRYWRLGDLKRAFTDSIGETSITADCFFGLGWQWSDYAFMAPRLKPISAASEALRRLSDIVTPLRQVADSVFCTAVKR